MTRRAGDAYPRGTEPTQVDLQRSSSAQVGDNPVQIHNNIIIGAAEERGHGPEQTTRSDGRSQPPQPGPAGRRRTARKHAAETYATAELGGAHRQSSDLQAVLDNRVKENDDLRQEIRRLRIIAVLCAAAAAVVVFAGSVWVVVTFASSARSAPDSSVSASTVPPGPATPSEDALALSEPSAVNRKSLVTSDPLDDRSSGFQAGSLKVNGVRYDNVKHAELLCYVVGNVAEETYQLDRKYRRFTAQAGLGDDSSSSPVVRFTVLADGDPVHTESVRVGEVKPIEADVSGAFRVSLRAEANVDCSTGSAYAYAAWIDPVVE
jgi:hypothetical protein